MQHAFVTVADYNRAGLDDLRPRSEPAAFLIDQVVTAFGLIPFFAGFDFIDEDECAAERAVLNINPDNFPFTCASNIGVFGDQDFFNAVSGNGATKSNLTSNAATV
jgi:hypothetical protein